MGLISPRQAHKLDSLIVKNQCALAVYHHFTAFHLAQSGFVYFTVGAYDGVFAFRYLDCAEFLVGVEDDVDVVPSVASGMVLQAESNETVLRREKLKMSADKVGIAHVESWMRLAEMDEAAVVFEHLWIDLEVVPVETVDAVG